MILEQPLTVLIANIYLIGRSGTEIATREVACALMRAGHRPIVYAHELGPIAEEIRARGIPVTDDISPAIAGDVDVIHGNHNQVTAIAAARFPNAPALYFAHDFVAWHSAPPLLANVWRYVAVDDTVTERLPFGAGIPTDRIVTLLNAVDTDRFAAGPPLPERPGRALAAKNAQHLYAVRAACTQRGVELDVIGGAVGNIVNEPEILLPQYDLVFASALSALEAMACGRAVIVCDGRGLAGMARSDNWDGWRRRNFGLRVLQRRLSVAAIAAEIDRYDAVDAAEISRRTRDEASMSKWLSACLLLYGEAIRQYRAAPPVSHELNLSLARHMQTWLPKPGPIWPWMTEREDLLRQLAGQPAELEPAELEPVEASKPISLEQADDPERLVRLTGFSAVEPWGVWTDSDLATIEFKISSAAAPTSLRLRLIPFRHEHHPEVIAELFINGTQIERRVFAQAFRDAPLFFQQDWKVALPPEARLGRSLTIGLRIENPASPLQLGLSGDGRRLGLGLCLIVLGE